MKEQIDHPSHYNNHPSGVECIEIVEHMPYNIGTAVAYLWRHQDKHDDKTVDLKKAIWHIQREIDKLCEARKYRIVALTTTPKTEVFVKDLPTALTLAMSMAQKEGARMEIESDKKALYGVTFSDKKFNVYEY